MCRRGFRNNETYRQSERGARGYSIDQIDWGGHEWGWGVGAMGGDRSYFDSFIINDVRGLFAR